MRKELGKWSMDIAKYIMTVVILSKFFSDTDIKTEWFITGIIAVILTLSFGLYMVRDTESKRPKRKKK